MRETIMLEIGYFPKNCSECPLIKTENDVRFCPKNELKCEEIEAQFMQNCPLELAYIPEIMEKAGDSHAL